MKFNYFYKNEIKKDNLIIYKDESILSKNVGDFIVYLGKQSFSLSVDKKTKKIQNFVGYISDFISCDFIDVPLGIKGEVFIEGDLNGEGIYNYDISAKGYYSPRDGWFKIGDDEVIGIVIEITNNTLLNIVDNKLKTVYFKAYKK